MKTLHTSLLFALAVLPAAVHAAPELKIESENQFAGEYADQIEQLAPGVYQFHTGPFQGKVVTIGEAGLRFDLDLHRERVAARSEQGRSAGISDQLVTELEVLLDAYTTDALDEKMKQDAPSVRAASSGVIGCSYWHPSWPWPVDFAGAAYVQATTELFVDRGDGSFNPYYARAHAAAAGYLNKPSFVPSLPYLNASVRAENRQTGAVVQYNQIGINYVELATGAVHSGPVFSHDLYAYARVNGEPRFCRGYVAISDSFN